MKSKMLITLLGALVLVTGCVSTVNDRHSFALSPRSDKFENRFDRPVDQVYAAALDVVRYNGTVSRESVIYPGANAVKSIEGKVNGRKVWVRVESVDPKVSSVKVQVRTSGGGTDQVLTQQLQTQIAVKLASQ